MLHDRFCFCIRKGDAQVTSIRRYLSNSIRHKMTLLLIALTSIPVIIASALAYNNSVGSMEKEAIRSNQVLTEVVGENLKDQLIQYENILFSNFYDNRFLRSLTQINSEQTTTRYEAQQYLSQKLYSLYLASVNSIEGIHLHIRSNGKTIIAKNYNTYMIDNTPDMWDFTADIADFSITPDANLPVYYLRKPIRNFLDQEIIGGITLEVNRSLLEAIADPLRDDANSSVYLLDGDGQILDQLFTDNGTQRPANPFQSMTGWQDGAGYAKDGEAYYFHYALDSHNIALLKQLPVRNVRGSAMLTLYYSLITGAVFVIISIVISLVMSRRITKPIIELVSHMNTVKRDQYDIDVKIDRNDEIGVLQQQFDTMIKRIRVLIEQEYFLVMAQRTSRLKALQAQINPHFLHNTMQMIGGIAIASNNTQIYQIVTALSESFRYIIQTPDELVTVNQEIAHTRNYLLIQEIRFDGRLDVDLTIDPDTEQCLIPLLTIQPIMENAFEHGLGKKKGQWSIKTDIRKQADKLIIRVQDNGVGIEPSKLEAIRDQLNQTDRFDFSESDRIGLINVHSRLKLFFGEPYGLNVQSEYGRRTTVEVMIPYVTTHHTKNEVDS